MQTQCEEANQDSQSSVTNVLDTVLQPLWDLKNIMVNQRADKVISFIAVSKEKDQPRPK